MKKALFEFAALALLGACEEVINEVPATSITFDEPAATMKVGETKTLTVTVEPENTTDKVEWESLMPENATVENGVVTALQEGFASIVAKAGEVQATCRILITAAAGDETFVIEPAPVTLAIDEEAVLTAVMKPSGTKVKAEWKCDKPDILALGAINDSQAKIQGQAAGKATVTAYADGKTATCEVTVTGGGEKVPVTSITLNKTQLNMTVGQKETLVATIHPDNATDKALNWSVMDNRIVSVTASGELTANSTGTTTVTVISVMYPNVQASCQVTVTTGGGGGGGDSSLNSVSIDPSAVTLSLNEEKALTLVLDPADAEVAIHWESSFPSIAKVEMTSKTTAKVTGLAAGQSQLTVYAGNLTATCLVTVQSTEGGIHVTSVTLNEHELELSVNQQFQLVATVLPENATEKGVVWSSNVSGSKLQVSPTGMVTCLQACEATVTVRCKDNAYIYDTCKITVTGSSSGTEDEVVDLGLSVKWRSMNVGATKPEEYGHYYAWAETSPKTSYTSSNYKYPSTNYGDGIIVYAKYDTTPVQGDKKTVLEAEDDAATANLGNGWRTPTFKEFKELRESCTWTWTNRNGVNGMLVTGPNGKSIFLPAGGWYNGSTLNNKGSYGSYWTATGDGGTANAVDFVSSDKDKALVPRSEGRSIRPVKD
ncbi:MAG: Ig-like domain-containing protein [Bacteroidales bacterium]|nr:Ig-like domain-containing protein [Bacteroidales bacterium]